MMRIERTSSYPSLAELQRPDTDDESGGSPVCSKISARVSMFFSIGSLTEPRVREF